MTTAIEHIECTDAQFQLLLRATTSAACENSPDLTALRETLHTARRAGRTWVAVMDTATILITLGIIQEYADTNGRHRGRSGDTLQSFLRNNPVVQEITRTTH